MQPRCLLSALLCFAVACDSGGGPEAGGLCEDGKCDDANLGAATCQVDAECSAGLVCADVALDGSGLCLELPTERNSYCGDVASSAIRVLPSPLAATPEDWRAVCAPSSSPGTDCGFDAGQCIDDTIQSCGGDLLVGECPGGNHIRCCDGGEVGLLPPGADIATLWLVGDSFSVGVESRVRQEFGELSEITVRGKVGDTIQGRRPHIDAAVSDGTDALVIQAGINNVGGGFINVTSLRSAIAGAMDAASSVSCVVWPTYQTRYVRGPYTVLGQAKSSLGGLSVSQKLNQLIREEAAERANVFVADFQPLADPQVDSWISSDGLHPSQTGYRELAKLYKATVDENCASAE